MKKSKKYFDISKNSVTFAFGNGTMLFSQGLTFNLS